jgi:hypothetical protein
MAEINGENRRPLYAEDHQAAEREELRRAASREINAPRALGDELDEIEATAAALLALRNRLRAKANGLYTGTQVGDLQASEASLVSVPLRRELEAVRRAWSAETVRREDAERKLAEFSELDSRLTGQIELDLRDRIGELEGQRDRANAAARRAHHTSASLQARVQRQAEDIARLNAELGRRKTQAQVADIQADARGLLRRAITSLHPDRDAELILEISNHLGTIEHRPAGE